MGKTHSETQKQVEWAHVDVCCPECTERLGTLSAKVKAAGVFWCAECKMNYRVTVAKRIQPGEYELHSYASKQIKED